MSLQNFIPTVWSARLLRNLHKAHVYANPLVINRDYEGEITGFGDTVKIGAIGPITTRPYTRNTDIVSPDVLESAQTILTIDQSQYFNFGVDDVDKAQMKPQVMDEAMYEAGYAVADVVDTFLAGLAAPSVPTANTIGTAGAPQTDLATAGKAYAYMVTLNQYLTQSNVPLTGRWIIVPPWFYAYIQKDPNFLHATGLGDVMLRMGILAPGEQPTDAGLFVGMIAGFSVFLSNNVPSVGGATAYQILAGHKIAWSYADNLTEIEAYRPPYRFADAIKGLHVYGAKVVKPQALACLYANPS